LNKIIIISLACFIFSCCRQQANNAALYLTEEDAERAISNEFNLIGEDSTSIVNNLSKCLTHNDILKYINDRGQKNNRKAINLGFNSYQLIEDIWTQERKRINLIYLIHGDSISYINVTSIDSSYSEIHKNQVIEINKSLAQRYISTHNTTFNTNKVISDYLTELVSKIYSVQMTCGFDGSIYKDEGVKLVEAVKKIMINHCQFIT
jgi:hypothetical protein